MKKYDYVIDPMTKAQIIKARIRAAEKHPYTFVLDDDENTRLKDAIATLANKNRINLSYSEGIRVLLRMSIAKVLK